MLINNNDNDINKNNNVYFVELPFVRDVRTYHVKAWASLDMVMCSETETCKIRSETEHKQDTFRERSTDGKYVEEGDKEEEEDEEEEENEEEEKQE